MVYEKMGLRSDGSGFDGILCGNGVRSFCGCRDGSSGACGKAGAGYSGRLYGIQRVVVGKYRSTQREHDLGALLEFS